MVKNIFIHPRTLVLGLFLFYFSGITEILGQSEFLDRGVSGFGMAAGVALQAKDHGVSGSFAYTFSGIFDIGIDIGKSSLTYYSRTASKDTKLRGKYVSPTLGLSVVKQNEQFPLSVCVFGTYQWIEYSGEYTGIYQDDLYTSAEGIFVGAGIYRKIDITPYSGIVPAMYAGHSDVGNIASDHFINTFGVNFSFFARSDRGQIIFFSPGLGVGHDERVLVVSLGIVFPTTGK